MTSTHQQVTHRFASQSFDEIGTAGDYPLVGGQRIMTMSTAILVAQPSVVNLRKFALLNAKFRNHFHVKCTFGVYMCKRAFASWAEIVRDPAGANCIPTITDPYLVPLTAQAGGVFNWKKVTSECRLPFLLLLAAVRIFEEILKPPKTLRKQIRCESENKFRSSVSQLLILFVRYVASTCYILNAIRIQIENRVMIQVNSQRSHQSTRETHSLRCIYANFSLFLSFLSNTP